MMISHFSPSYIAASVEPESIPQLSVAQKDKSYFANSFGNEAATSGEMPIKDHKGNAPYDESAGETEDI
jgi:hypothetical protein